MTKEFYTKINFSPYKVLYIEYLFWSESCKTGCKTMVLNFQTMVLDFQTSDDGVGLPNDGVRLPDDGVKDKTNVIR